MIPDTLRRAVRDGPEAFGPHDIGRRALGLYLHWRTWATMVVVVVGFYAAAYAHVRLPEGWAFLAVFGAGWATCRGVLWTADKYELETRY